MPQHALNILCQSLTRVTAGELRTLADAELLARFISQSDETAFAALMRRHGPLVLGVCRRILYHDQDAEDAFQETFLVLARTARAIRRRESLSCWLHGVARRTALRLKSKVARRSNQDLAGIEPVAKSSAPSSALQEAMQIFDEELTRLPSHYRAPLILCYLEGQTQDEAARQLGWKLGTFRGRLERARDKLRERLTRRGISVPAVLVGLALGGIAHAVPAALIRATARAVALGAGGQAMGVGLSAAVLQAAKGVYQTMFASKATSFVTLGIVIILGVGSVTLVPGVGSPAPTAVAGEGTAKVPPKPDAPKSGAEIKKLIARLGHAKFAEREAAQKKLWAIGKAALPAIQAGTKAADHEIARRCVELLAQVKTDALKDRAHPVWVRFKKIAGDDRASRALFLEMVADVRRGELLETAEATPDRAGEIYRTELVRQVKELKRGYKEAEAAAGGRLGELWPTRGIPTPGEFGTLLFLGTYPATAAVTFQQANDADRFSHHGVFAHALNRKAEANPVIPPPLRRLFAAWLLTRTDPNPIQFGMNLAVYHRITEVAAAARANAANAALAPNARGFALLAVGRFGTVADLPLLETAFADARVFHATNYTSPEGRKSPVEALVGDAAIAAALRLSGQHPADFGFPLLEMYKERGPDTLARYHLLGFFDRETRAAAHKKAKEWLDKQKKEKPLPFDKQVQHVESRIADLQLVEVQSLKTSLDTRKPIRFEGSNGEVKITAGSAMLIELPKPAREMTWRSGDRTEAIGDRVSAPFTHILCKWDAEGKLTWVMYRPGP
ncbi:MAG TPA: RNA polymerase sigma factor [Gemmataceae bacterium]|nr:RNA polymerase sigma factor [Gemmataceae bacterium]